MMTRELFQLPHDKRLNCECRIRFLCDYFYNDSVSDTTSSVWRFKLLQGLTDNGVPKKLGDAYASESEHCKSH
jgi:hypothetical protein